ncbi:MAG: YoaK family protein [Reyranella sp.]|uniref:YoaK family protein n=1 Tax=Reyranella sp. TaxID=1929291 RepID=UPI003D131262
MTIARQPSLQATLLTLVAGIADAVGYITMGGVFAANMTGNTVLAGIAIAEAHYADAARHLSPLVTFFIGAMLARLILRLWRKPAMAIALEAALLAGLDFLPLGMESKVLVIAFAMGLQASAITQFAGASISTVVVTSTLARTADAALDALLPSAVKAQPATTTPRLLLLTWLGYLAGAIAGALLLHVMPWPLIVPAALLVVVMVL